MFQFLSNISLSWLMMQARFAASGLIATAVNYGVFWLLLGILGVGAVVAAGIAFFLSTGVNFTLQRTWTYRLRSSQRYGRQLAVYAGFGAALLMLNDTLFSFFTGSAHLGYLPTELLLTAIVSAISWWFTRLMFQPQPQR